MSETTFTRDDGGMTDRYLVVRQSNGQVVFDTDDFAEAQQVKKDCEDVDEQNAYCIADTRITPPTPESDAHREVRKSVVCERCYGLTSCWCPPTPDRAAVREALVCVLQSASLKSVDNLDDVLGSHHTAKFEDTADALLAAVSRPAPLPANVPVWTEGDIENLRHVGRSPACGPQRGGALLDLADRLASHQSADASKTLPADVQAVVAHVGQMAEHYLALADQTDNVKMRDVYERDGNALRTLLAHLQRDTRPAPVVTEAVLSAVQKLEGACEDGGWVSESWVREQCRAITAAPAAARGEK